MKTRVLQWIEFQNFDLQKAYEGFVFLALFISCVQTNNKN